MKLLATGDWQAGVSTVELEDQEAVWHRIVDVALEAKVDLFLHGGDLHEGPMVSMEQLAAVRRVFNRLRAAEIPIVVTRGNSRHDLALREVDALDVFRDYSGITVASRPAVEYIAGVAVCCLPWVSSARLVADHDLVVDRDRVNEYAADLLVKIAGEMFREAGRLWPNRPRVLLAHWAISGSSLPTGLPVDQLREPVLEWEALDEIGFEAVVASHIHKQQNLTLPASRTVGFYTGSPQPLNHGEEKDEHGCWLLEVGGLLNESEFVPIESRPFQTLDLNVGSLDSHGGSFELASVAGIKPGVILRVRYRATDEQARRVNHDSMRAFLLDAGASRVTIEPEIVRAERARVAGVTESLGVDEALRAFCEAQEVEGPIVELMSERLGAWRA